MLLPPQDGQAKNSRQTADERFYGVGASGQEKVGGPVSQSSQRGAQQDAGKALEVSFILVEFVPRLCWDRAELWGPGLAEDQKIWERIEDVVTLS